MTKRERPGALDKNGGGEQSDIHSAIRRIHRAIGKLEFYFEERLPAIHLSWGPDESNTEDSRREKIRRDLEILRHCRAADLQEFRFERIRDKRERERFEIEEILPGFQEHRTAFIWAGQICTTHKDASCGRRDRRILLEERSAEIARDHSGENTEKEGSEHDPQHRTGEAFSGCP